MPLLVDEAVEETVKEQLDCAKLQMGVLLLLERVGIATAERAFISSHIELTFAEIGVATKSEFEITSGTCTSAFTRQTLGVCVTAHSEVFRFSEAFEFIMSV